MAGPAIETRNLTKTFPEGTVALGGLDLEIPRGVVYGLMGRNGAGKTTTLRLLMGLLRPDRGEARVLGANLARAGREARGRAAYVSQSQQLPGWMTLPELCRYASHFYECWDSDFAADLALRWGISRERPLGALSGGEQRKAAVLMALAPRPEVLLLDEPAAGLDPISRRELIEELIAVLSRGPGCTVLFSTHIISDLERIAERVGILDRGQLRVDRDLDELKGAYRRVQVIFPGEAPPPHFVIPGAGRCQFSGPVVSGVTAIFDGEHIEALRRWPGVRVQIFPIGLEDIFMEVVGKPVHEPAPVEADEPEIFEEREMKMESV